MERNKITNLNKNDLNKDLFDTELMSYNSKTGKNEWVTPRVMTKTIYNDKGENLDDILQFTPDDLKQVLYEILDGAPEAYNSFKEVADALDKNKNSISEIFNEIARRVKKPEIGKPGQVLMLNEAGEIIFADDNDTVYEHPKKHKPREIETDTNNRFVSDEEKRTWNNKLDEDSYINKNLVDVCVYDNECYTVTFKEFADTMMYNIHSLHDEKGNPDGIATLNSNGKVPVDQLPEEALKTYDLSKYVVLEELDKYKKADGTTIGVLTAQGRVDANNIKEEWFFAHYDSINTPDREKGWYINTFRFERFPFQIAYDAKDKEEIYFRTGKDNSFSEWTKIATEYDFINFAKASDLDKKEEVARKGQAGGYASLDENGHVPASQLPSYVDDVMEITSLPAKGEKGKIYVNTNTNQVFRWSGTQFISIIDVSGLEEKLNKKPDVISLTEDEFNRLTTFKDNTLYLVQENA